MRDPDLRPLLLRSAQATQLAVEKGILHAANRDRFPRPLPDRGPVTLQLVLTEVHCLQDTVEINRDDMWLAGITHDRCGLTTRSISPILLGRYREDTRERMKKTVASFQLPPSPSRMVPYLVTLVLGEGEGVPRQLSAYVADLHAASAPNEFPLPLGSGVRATETRPSFTGPREGSSGSWTSPRYAFHHGRQRSNHTRGGPTGHYALGFLNVNKLLRDIVGKEQKAPVAA